MIRDDSRDNRQYANDSTWDSGGNGFEGASPLLTCFDDDEDESDSTLALCLESESLGIAVRSSTGRRLEVRAGKKGGLRGTPLRP